MESVGTIQALRVDAHLNSARAAVERGRSPGDSAITVNLNMDVEGHIEHPVVAANRDLHQT